MGRRTAVNRPAQRTANKNRMANLKETHGKISAHDSLRLKLMAKPGTRPNLQETHSKQTPTTNWCIGPTYAANLTAHPNGQYFAVSLAVTHGKIFNFPMATNIASQIYKILNLAVNITAQIFKIWLQSLP
jgi:hypothetical protein